MTFDWSMRYDHAGLKGLVGRTITAVRLDQASDAVEFDTDEGVQRYEAEGDCCSSSWIEHMDNPAQILGSPVLSVLDNEMGEDASAHDRDCEVRDKPRPAQRDYDAPEPKCWCDCVQVYQYVVQTAKGHMALEMRNSSNGYYGGTLYRAEPRTTVATKGDEK